MTGGPFAFIETDSNPGHPMRSTRHALGQWALHRILTKGCKCSIKLVQPVFRLSMALKRQISFQNIQRAWPNDMEANLPIVPPCFPIPWPALSSPRGKHCLT